MKLKIHQSYGIIKEHSGEEFQSDLSCSVRAWYFFYSVKIIITTFNSRTRIVFSGRGFVDKV